MFNHKKNTYLEINSTKIYYEDIGSKEKEILLLLHGGFGNIEDLNEIADSFSKKYRILAIDSRGHGASTLGNEGLSYKLLEDDVYAVLNYLGISKISIIGFSDGGIIALRMASSKKINIEKMALIGTSWSKNDIEEISKILDSITCEKAKMIFESEYKLYEQINKEPNFEQFTKEVVTMWKDKSQSGHPDTSVENITCDTLLIRGDNDFLVSLTSQAQLQKKIANCSFLNVPFCSHTVYKEDYKTVSFALEKFFK
ncbi:alpha/beta fold hydrolase [Arcobacter sp.]|uniref:alpha/beta fold hydrolase n=1 Tax=Arcobacter sp. TaxID=1872629 RepID=UPI003D0A6DE2